jgi:hypothetical protein
MKFLLRVLCRYPFDPSRPPLVERIRAHTLDLCNTTVEEMKASAIERIHRM